jgi:hypothetical protein
MLDPLFVECAYLFYVLVESINLMRVALFLLLS